MDSRFKAYRATNRQNGKVYIGITTMTLAARWALHVKAAAAGAKYGKLPAAIRKHGANEFDIEHIASSVSWEHLCETEKQLIAQYGSFEAGYNATRGGEGIVGVSWSEETNKRRVQSYLRTLARKGGCVLKGRPKSEQHKASMAISRRATMDADPTLKIKLIAGSHASRVAVRRNKNSRALTDEQVSFCRHQRAEGVAFSDLGIFYGTTPSAIEHIVYGRRYKHVPMPSWSAA